MIDENYIKELKANKVSEYHIRTTEWILKKLDTFKNLETIDKNDLMDFFNKYEGKESSLSLIQSITKQYFRFI
ncbi:MAG: hypothetical protein QSU88_08485, partial [Candidatus Methanoperedens sp.]|nr:hypothetical protein [Candidatus Methanoperedens sp.]